MFDVLCPRRAPACGRQGARAGTAGGAILRRDTDGQSAPDPVVVVVNADDVGRDAFPAVIADHGTRRIERLRQVIQRLHVSDARRIVGQVRDAPRFVDRHPGHDAGMAVVAHKRLGPFAGRRARWTLW